ncbi:MAG: gliding motility-associated C-terminal domain-containing protein, partial [Bacteroidales bacterium]|nr:gliding motility-associated C-terminal domain-containing protein [Bacteroidales bacterium]
GCTYFLSFTITQPTALVAGIVSSTNISCNGTSTGSATVSATGGATPYVYLWNDIAAQTTATATGLAAGTYNVLITDANGCTASASVTITEPAAAIDITTVAAVPVNPTCSGAANGSIDITVTGGTAPYFYAWSNGTNSADASGLMGGNYFVTVTDALGCQITGGPYTLTEPAAVTITVSGIVNTQCSSALGSVVLTSSDCSTITLNGVTKASGSTWSGLVAGYYTATSNGTCPASASFNITNSNSTLAATVSVANPLCNGGTVTANVTANGGTAPYTFVLNGGTSNTTGVFAGLSAGNYNVLVTDANGCTFAVAFTITQPTALIAGIHSFSNISCNGASTGFASVIVSGGTAPYSYLWDDGTAQTTATATGLAAGTYIVIITDANGCTASAFVTITEPAAALDITTVATVITNPTCNGYNNGSIDITVSGGTAPYFFAWSNGQGIEDAGSLTAGNYFVTVTDANGCQITGWPYTLTEPAAVTITVSNLVNTQCNASAGSVVLTSSDGSTITVNGITLPSGSIFTGLAAGYHTAVSNGLCFATVTFNIINVNSTLAAVVNVAQPLCNDSSGTATVSVNGGMAPYSYQINNGTAQSSNVFTNLLPGVYNITVTDSIGCTYMVSFNVTVPTIIFAEIIINADETCAGTADGSATVNASGGTTPFTYLWSVNAGSQTTAIATGLSASTYTVTVTDANGCQATATVTIGVGPTPVVFAGLNDTICSNATYTLNGASVTNATSIVWSTSGTGTFSNMFIVNPVYTPSTADIAAGSVTLVMSAQSTSPCAAATDTIVLTIIPQPFINAGADASVCAGNTFTPSASGSNYTNLAWSSSGTGTFSNANILNAVYTPSASDLLAGSVMLTLTASTHASCANAVDNVVLTFINSVTANAGPDQTVYAQTSVTMNANNPAPGSGQWILISGPSVPFIVDPTNPNTNITGLTAGTYIFRWIVNNTPCPNTWDEMVVNNIPSADLAVVKTVSNANPVAGSQISYTITVTNNGPSTAQDVVVTDVLPAGLTIAGVTPGMGSWTAPLWTIGTLSNGQTATLQLLVNVNSTVAQGMVINNMASAGSSTFDPNMVNNSDTALVTVNTLADLSVTKVANSATIQAGNMVTYTITLTNNGPSMAANVVVTDVLPTGLTLVNATPDIGTWIAPVWNVGNVNTGSVYTLTVIAQVDPSLSNGTLIDNITSVTSSTTDPVSANNADTASIVVTALADLAITKVSSANPVLAGDTLTYTITVVNNGYSNAANVTVTDILPVDLVFVSATTTTGTWNAPLWTIGTLNSGDTAVLTVITYVQAGTPNGITISNTATVSSTTPDPDGSNNSDTELTYVNAFADLAITKTANNDTVVAGENVIYTITVTNYGISSAQNVTVNEMLPVNMTLVSAVPSTGTWTYPVWSLGTLLVGAQETLLVTATVNSNVAEGDTITNTVSVNSTTHDPDTLNNIDSYDINIITSADIRLAKSSQKTMYYQGDTVIYTINVTNDGFSDALNVIVTDVLPTGLTYVSGIVTMGTWNYPIWQVGMMTPGQTETLILRATVDSNMTGGTQIINLASATTDTYDPDTTNNTNNDGDALITISHADLAITKMGNVTSVMAGDNLSYTITVINNGPVTSYGLTITDTLPLGLIFISASDNGIYDSINNTVIWMVPTLSVNESVSFTLQTKVERKVTGGSIIENMVTVNSLTDDINLNNNTAHEYTIVQSLILPFIPQGFSPNGDGVNDYFVITGLEGFPNHSFMILNRWGNKVYEAAPYNNDWDGTNMFGITVGGNELPVGTYFYIFDTGIEGQEVIKGYIYLNR